jgi:hypothetical protein
MPIVVGGLGLPEEGSLVAGGLGVSESSPNAMSATLAGTSSLTATLTGVDNSGPPVAQPMGGGAAWYPLDRITTRPGRMAATLTGSSHLTARLDYEIDVDLLLEQFAAALLMDVI